MVVLGGAGPEVAQLHRALIAKQQVLHFQIAVNDGRRHTVHVLHRLGRLVERLEHHIAREGAAARPQKVHQLAA